MLQRLRALSFWVAAYLLAATTVAPLHHHGVFSCHSGGCGHLPSCSDHGEAAAASHDGAETYSAQAASDSSDHCAICRFLAQRTVPVADAPQVASPSPEREPFYSAPNRLVVRAGSSWHSRAPPSLA